MIGNLWGPFAGHVFSPVRQFHEKAETFLVLTPKYGKILVSLSFSLVYISLVGSVIVLPTVKLNRVSQPISIEYKMVHGLNQAVFKT